MTRKVIDCRDFPSEQQCTVAISADTIDELVDIAVLHAIDAHGHEDTPKLREMLADSIKEDALT
jgi:predicted small metal-binding protein